MLLNLSPGSKTTSILILIVTIFLLAANYSITSAAPRLTISRISAKTTTLKPNGSINESPNLTTLPYHLSELENTLQLFTTEMEHLNAKMALLVQLSEDLVDLVQDVDFESEIESDVGSMKSLTM